MENQQQHTTQNITVPNNDLEILKQHFPQCFDKDGNFQLEKFRKNLESSEINFSTESYGMDWLGKAYARLLASDPATTLLKADEAHNAKSGNKDSENLLIKGDNLEVLKHLSNAYHEKIKMIYIDPPYNTGSDGFVYQDDRKFTVAQLQNMAGVNEEQAQRILAFTQSKSNSHSAWLTFMYPRLYIAKQLLKDDGVIFISIDDNEVAQLRLLMDEVFGEENFVEIFSWIKTSTPPALSNKSRQINEFILCYEKNKNNYRYFGEALSGGDQPLLNDGNNIGTLIIPKDKIIFNINDGIYESGIYHRIKILEKITISDGKSDTDLKIEGRFKWQQSFLNQEIENGTTFIVKSDKFSIRFQRVEDESYKPPTNYIRESIINPILNKANNVDTNETASGNLFELFGVKIFNFPKPTSLIKYLINFIIKDSDLILDFFAGSGTTGDAVMQLNAEDNGNRKYILVQLPETIDSKKSKAAYDFVKNLTPTLSKGEGVEPTIFDITKERLIRAAAKINTELDTQNKDLEVKIKELKGQLQTDETIAEITDLQNQIAQNTQLKTQNTFKIFETTPIWEDYDFEADEFDTQQELFDADTLTPDEIKSLLVTWKTADGIPLTEDLREITLNKDYTAYYGNGKLYLMNAGFTTEHLKALLEKTDADKTFNPAAIIAFGYHFDTKNLREIAENVKSYANKKKIDIDFITRY